MSRTELESLVWPSVSVGEPLPASDGGNQETYGYRIYPLEDVDGSADSNAVLLDVAPGGSTELEHTVRRGQVMRVRALRGIGDAVLHLPDGRREIYDLSPDADPVDIPAGAVYRYLNTSVTN